MDLGWVSAPSAHFFGYHHDILIIHCTRDCLEVRLRCPLYSTFPWLIYCHYMSKQSSYNLLASSIRLPEWTLAHQRWYIDALSDQINLLETELPAQIVIWDV